MPIKYEQKRRKHELIHVSISLATILACTLYMLYNRNWTQIGIFGKSWLIPIVLIGELLKVNLARSYTRHYDEEPDTQMQRQSPLTPQEVLEDIILQFFCVLLYAFATILLGAPMLGNYGQTFELALLLTLLTVSPTVFLLSGRGAFQACFSKKPDFMTQSEYTALNLFKYNAIGGIVGAWSASIVAPLDWDRDWQIYPIPNIVGALLGSAIANIYAYIILKV